jgi:glycosyltransferase involved in cell wall biosynthesis
MVTCNHRQFVKRAIESVLAQTYGDWKLCIIDDRSIDGTQAVLREFLDSRVRIICRDTAGGICAAYRQGMSVCTGEYLAFLEGDDEWLPTNLHEKMEVFAQYPELGVVYSNVTIEGAGIAARKKRYLRTILSVPAGRPFDAAKYAFHMNPIPTFSAAIVRRGLLANADTVYPCSRDEIWLDWFFWNHVSLTTRFYFLSGRLVVWRHHAGSLYGRMEKGRLFQGKSREIGLRFRFLWQAWQKPLSAGRKIAITAAFCRGLAMSVANLLHPANFALQK